MKYETPNIEVLRLAVDAIQVKPISTGPDGAELYDNSPAYEDWE